MDHIRWSLLSWSVHVARVFFALHNHNNVRIARNHSGLGPFLFKFHLLRLRRLSSQQIGYPFHARHLIGLDFTNATRWSVFPLCTFRREMVIYTHRSMSLSARWNSFIIDLFNTETRYDTPTRKSSFSWDGDANTWGVALSCHTTRNGALHNNLVVTFWEIIIELCHLWWFIFEVIHLWRLVKLSSWLDVTDYFGTVVELMFKIKFIMTP
jgi:hypothetical protein